MLAALVRDVSRDVDEIETKRLRVCGKRVVEEGDPLPVRGPAGRPRAAARALDQQVAPGAVRVDDVDAQLRIVVHYRESAAVGRPGRRAVGTRRDEVTAGAVGIGDVDRYAAAASARRR